MSQPWGPPPQGGQPHPGGRQPGPAPSGGWPQPGGRPGGGWQQPAPQQQPGQPGSPVPSGQWPSQVPQQQSGAWSPPAAQPGGVMLRTGFFPLAFLLYFFPPKASIDGSAPFDLRWGENPLPGVPPGRHRVRVWFRYMFFGECGVADAFVDVSERGTFLEYKAPTWFVWNQGSFPSLARQGVAAGGGTAGAAGGAWHPDPLGRAEQRYWDGQQWTGHVVRAGQQGWDPL